MKYQIVSERYKDYSGSIKKPEDAYNLLKRFWKASREHFILITLDGAHQPISISIVSIGLVNKTIVHPREVFIRAIQDMATAIIIAHNHLSGTLKPSAEDEEITSMICEAGKLMGIHVLDHLIFSRRGYISLRQDGNMKSKTEEEGM